MNHRIEAWILPNNPIEPKQHAHTCHTHDTNTCHTHDTNTSHNNICPQVIRVPQILSRSMFKTFQQCRFSSLLSSTLALIDFNVYTSTLVNKLKDSTSWVQVIQMPRLSQKQRCRIHNADEVVCQACVFHAVIYNTVMKTIFSIYLGACSICFVE
jgi:hypothetical protein